MNYQEFSGKIKAKYPQYQDMDDRDLAQRMVTKYPQYRDVTFDDMPTQTPPLEQTAKTDALPLFKPQAKQGLIGKAWGALAVPERMSKQGLDLIAKSLPEAGQSKSALVNFLRGTPKVLAETAAESAPGFVSRGAMVMPAVLKGYKAVKPLLAKGGAQVAKAAEAISGLEYKTPGVLTEAFKNPKLIFGKGTKEAGELFSKLVDKGRIRPEFALPLKNDEVVTKALEYAKDNTLTPEEALLARRSLDAIKKHVSAFGFRETRKIFDTMAKIKSLEADIEYAKAIKADALRTIFPINKSGGTSIFKGVLGRLTKTLPFMSPAAQGYTATTAGAASKAIDALTKRPIDTGIALGAGISGLKKKRNNSQNNTNRNGK
jgi:hypothetical protein